jgi:hypothetical protein
LVAAEVTTRAVRALLAFARSMVGPSKYARVSFQIVSLKTSAGPKFASWRLDVGVVSAFWSTQISNDDWKGYSPQAAIVLEDIVSGQVVKVDGRRIWIRVRWLREIVQVIDDAHIPIEDFAENFYGYGFADSFPITRQVPVVRQGVEHWTWGSDC